MTSDDIRCYLMTSDVLVLHYIKLVVEIFCGVVEKIVFKLSVSLFVCCQFVNFQFFELLDAAKNASYFFKNYDNY